MTRSHITWRAVGAALAATLALAGCGGGDSGTTEEARPPTEQQLVSGATLAGWPHEIDYYVPAGATRAVVVLHGATGRNFVIAAALGVNGNVSVGGVPEAPTADTVEWAWLNQTKTIAVFPQGQLAPGTGSATTWSNHTMDSGVNDVAFLQALAAHIRETYGVSQVAIAGHSMGGVMVNRMWCESPDTFDQHIALAGPASAYYLEPGTACRPSRIRPYLGIIGDSDSVMQNQPWTAATWEIVPPLSETPGFVDPFVIGEWVQHQRRAALACSAAPVLADGITAGAVTTWSACGGTVVQRLVSGADHGLQSIEEQAGRTILSYIGEFMGAR